MSVLEKKTILVIGSGPVGIGQSRAFDHSGAQACKALRRSGCRVVLANPNPAAVMTDPALADATYIEPLDLERLEEIIVKEKPDAIAHAFGGYTGIDLAFELDRSGLLAKHGVEVIGIGLGAVDRCQDRVAFRKMMEKLGAPLPRGGIASTLPEAQELALGLGYPVALRPAGSAKGNAVAADIEALRSAAGKALKASPIRRIIVEESLEGWQGFEAEVLRDRGGAAVIASLIENIDPMGAQAGNSASVLPVLGAGMGLQREMEAIALGIAAELGLVGSANVQFAYSASEGRLAVAELLPRVSGSSAFASKASGFPIASVSATLAAGALLKDIPYWRDGRLDSYSATGDFVAVKLPRWPFEEMGQARDRIGSRTVAVGEAMGVGKNFKEALQKALRSLDSGRQGPGFAKDFRDKPKAELLRLLAEPSSERLFLAYEALRKGATVEELGRLTRIRPFFLSQLKELVELEESLLARPGSLPPDALLLQAKKDGFSDAYLSSLLGLPESRLRAKRLSLGLGLRWQALPVSCEKNSFYFYSTYNGKDEVAASTSYRKAMLLGGGPARLGQGLGSDCCCAEAAAVLRDCAYETVMVDCDPGAASAEYDAADRVYISPFAAEELLSIWEKEKPRGLILQFGTPLPLALARELEANGARIMGSGLDAMEAAHDRELFRRAMDKLGVPVPESGSARGPRALRELAEGLGYPLVVEARGGAGSETARDEDELDAFLARLPGDGAECEFRAERFLEEAPLCEADLLCDGKEAYLPAIIEHIEAAGIHPADSACVIPPVSISEASLKAIRGYAIGAAKALEAVGLLNLRFAIEDGKVYALDASLRASPTVPFVSKVCDLRLARIATRILIGSDLGAAGLSGRRGISGFGHYGVRRPVFPFERFPEIDPALGPRARSTGEVIGMADGFALAFFKAEEAAGSALPGSGTILMSLRRGGRKAVEAGRAFARLGFRILATEETAKFLFENAVPCQIAKRPGEGRPNLLDAFASGEVQLVLSTPSRRGEGADDSYIRKAAIAAGIPYLSTVEAALASAQGIEAARPGKGGVSSLQDYHREME